jgi:hypothetical protein
MVGFQGGNAEKPVSNRLYLSLFATVCKLLHFPMLSFPYPLADLGFDHAIFACHSGISNGSANQGTVPVSGAETITCIIGIRMEKNAEIIIGHRVQAVSDFHYFSRTH